MNFYWVFSHSSLLSKSTLNHFMCAWSQIILIVLFGSFSALWCISFLFVFSPSHKSFKLKLRLNGGFIDYSYHIMVTKIIPLHRLIDAEFSKSTFARDNCTIIFYKFISFHLLNHDGLGTFDLILTKKKFHLVLYRSADCFEKPKRNEMKLSVSSFTCIIIDNVFNRWNY